MRQSSTYRGARRNRARAGRTLGVWRRGGANVVAANYEAKLYARSIVANAAREAVAKAIAHARTTGAAIEAAVHAAYVAFYAGQPRSRVVSRILRQLGPLPKAKGRARGANVLPADDVARAAAAYKAHGSERKAANALGIAKTTLRNRLMRAAERGLVSLTRAARAV